MLIKETIVYTVAVIKDAFSLEGVDLLSLTLFFSGDTSALIKEEREGSGEVGTHGENSTVCDETWSSCSDGRRFAVSSVSLVTMTFGGKDSEITIIGFGNSTAGSKAGASNSSLLDNVSESLLVIAKSLDSMDSDDSSS